MARARILDIGLTVSSTRTKMLRIFAGYPGLWISFKLVVFLTGAGVIGAFLPRSAIGSTTWPLMEIGMELMGYLSTRFLGEYFDSLVQCASNI